MLFMDYDPLFAVALVMIVVAFGFKAAAAPFHLWAPDVYQGAPPSAAALIASASKLAAFVLFTRLFWGTPGVNPFLTAIPAWMPVIAVLAGFSLLLGNLVALAQSDLRRLLAYSAIAHAGGLLLGVIAVGSSGPAPLFYYLFTYGIAAAGVFGVIAALESAGGVRQLSDLAGLSQRSPLLAGCLMVFVLSLAGIPPLAGFFGKFVVFTAALGVGGVASPVGWLTLLAIALSAVGLYYYLIILKHALVRSPRADAPPVSVPIPAAFALLLAAAVTILLGVFPSLLFGLM